MIIATVIGGLLVILLYLASFYLRLSISLLLVSLLITILLYIQVSLQDLILGWFLRSIFEFRFSQFIHYIARFFLIILHLIAAIFVGGFLFSFVMKLSILEVGASAILWFLALNIILINLTYGNGHHQYQRVTWLNTLTLSSIILLNFFSLFHFTAFQCVSTNTVGVSLASMPLASHSFSPSLFSPTALLLFAEERFGQNLQVP